MSSSSSSSTSSEKAAEVVSFGKAKRTQEFYGFLKGDPNLAKAGLRVRIFDSNNVERTDPSETFLTRQTAGGIIYRVRAYADQFYDTPSDRKTGLRDKEQFYVTFQQVGFDVFGWPARSIVGTIFKLRMFSTLRDVNNIDFYLSFFNFNITPNGGKFVDRPTISIDSFEPDASYILTTDGSEPQVNAATTTTLPASGQYKIQADGDVELRIAGIDRFGNVNLSKTFEFQIENPTIKVLEAVSLDELEQKRYFYQEAYTIDGNSVYTRIDRAAIDKFISAPATLHDVLYVPLEPGILNGLIFGPRYARLASNRSGSISFEVLHNDETAFALSLYSGSLITLDQPTVTIRMQFTDRYLGTTGVIAKTYSVIKYGPIIENVTVSNGNSNDPAFEIDGLPMVDDRQIVVNILTKGSQPQVVTIGQNEILSPVETDDCTPEIIELCNTSSHSSVSSASSASLSSASLSSDSSLSSPGGSSPSSISISSDSTGTSSSSSSSTTVSSSSSSITSDSSNTSISSNSSSSTSSNSSSSISSNSSSSSSSNTESSTSSSSHTRSSNSSSSSTGSSRSSMTKSSVTTSSTSHSQSSSSSSNTPSSHTDSSSTSSNTPSSNTFSSSSSSTSSSSVQ